MKIILFCAYFGALPSHFDLWLESCRFNTDVTFNVFTDDRRTFELPSNVLIKKISFEEFKELIASKLGMKISLETPYKLCDYKPLFGFLFEEYTVGYDYWGYCDLDMIFGNISSYLPNFEFDKASRLAHLCLIKNTVDNNRLFMKSIASIDYKDILSSHVHFAFDEIGEYGINRIFNNEGKKIYNLEQFVADIYPKRRDFYIVKHNVEGKRKITKNKYFFEFNNGHIYGYDEFDNKVEFCYVHFQKRRMNNNVRYNRSKFYIIPNQFTNDKIEQSSTFVESLVYLFYSIKLTLKAINYRLLRFCEQRKIGIKNNKCAQ